MQLTKQQINDFTARAKAAGLNDAQIQQEIAKKVQEFNVNNGLTQPPAVNKPNVPSSTPSTTSTYIPDTSMTGIDGQEEGFLSTFIKGITQPAIDYGKLVGEAVYQGGKYIFDPTFRKLVNGEKLTPEELAQVNTDTAFYGKEEGEKKLGTGKDLAITGLKATAGMESYFIPFGKGANIMTKAILPGATSAAMAEFSKEDSTPTSVLTAGVEGGVTSGILEGIGGIISWAKGKDGDLIRQAENLDEATRKINVKASVYGASKEKAINKTLDEYGFKGTAQAQYEKLEPTMATIEEKLQGVIKDNPQLSITKKEVTDSFMANLKSSMRTGDLTKKQAIEEVNSYLGDLLKASGGTGKFTNIDMAKLRDMKKLLNEDYGTVFTKMLNNTPLSPKEKVIAAAWSSLDDAVKTVSPEIKKLLVDESNLYQAAHSLHAARYNPPTFRFMGTSVPAGVTQKLRDLGSGTLRKLGEMVGGIPEGNDLTVNVIQKLAVLTPVAMKERGMTDEEISQVEDFQNTIKANNPTGANPMGANPTGPATEQTKVDYANTPNPQNPFGGLSKRQVLSLALSQGASVADLKSVGEMYDMLMSDPNVVDADAQKTADNLRTEYFSRTKDNKFLDANNNYQKVMSTSDSPQGDISLIFAFMKMLDPGSVVREGEYATAENTAGIPTQIVNQYNKALKGTRLSKEQRLGYKREAARVFQVYQQRQAPIDAYYQGLAKRYGIDPSLLGVGLYGNSQ